MKIRIMGLPLENEKLINALKRSPEIDIISISRSYANRGNSKEERIYIECKVDVNYVPADVVESLLLEEPNELLWWTWQVDKRSSK